MAEDGPPEVPAPENAPPNGLPPETDPSRSDPPPETVRQTDPPGGNPVRSLPERDVLRSLSRVLWC